MKSAIKVKFWGVRGSIPTPGRETNRYGGNTSCVEVRAGGKVFIIDSGTGIRNLGHALKREFKNKPLEAHVMISHTHWDHIQGFPFFSPAGEKKNTMIFYGAEESDRKLSRILSGQMVTEYFPISMHDLAAEIKFKDICAGMFKVNGVTIYAMFVNHPGISLAFKICVGNKAVTYLGDNEPIDKGKLHLLPKEDGHVATQEDREIHMNLKKKLEEFIQGSNLLITDAQYSRKDFKHRVGWGHSTPEDAIDLALKSGVERLVLFHHDPLHTDKIIDAMLKKCRSYLKAKKSKIICDAAKEGLVIRL